MKEKYEQDVVQYSEDESQTILYNLNKKEPEKENEEDEEDYIRLTSAPTFYLNQSFYRKINKKCSPKLIELDWSINVQQPILNAHHYETQLLIIVPSKKNDSLIHVFGTEDILSCWSDHNHKTLNIDTGKFVELFDPQIDFSLPILSSYIREKRGAVLINSFPFSLYLDSQLFLNFSLSSKVYLRIDLINLIKQELEKNVIPYNFFFFLFNFCFYSTKKICYNVITLNNSWTASESTIVINFHYHQGLSYKYFNHGIITINFLFDQNDNNKIPNHNISMTLFELYESIIENKNMREKKGFSFFLYCIFFFN